ncbi:hypothetical protein AAFF_G00233060 [Aldrovandia affinis]|uniref:Ig-like domain-containing protein n=1 Tax=Aldrovandia affinis TaxID=143900 RepID=A0AAD7RF56_9TELE|nr:hypothetical protein AAFF_G00233060 [Aldrovandia affinis]
MLDGSGLFPGDAIVPELTHHRDPVEGSPFTVTCSVIHTCPSHVPSLAWSHGTKENIIVAQKDILHRNWETQSILTFIPTEKYDHTEVSCMASYHGTCKEHLHCLCKT